MPATNPRLTITLKPSTAAIVRTLSDLTGNSQSGLIAELLESNEQTLGRLVAVLQAAHTAKTSLTEEMSSGLKDAHEKLEKQLGLALETMDAGVAPILAAAEKVQRRAASKRSGGTRIAGGRGALEGRSLAVSTPMSNRGVRSDRKTANPPVKKGFPLPPAKVQAYADTNGVPPKHPKGKK